MNFAAIDWIIVIAYLLGSLGIGILGKRFVGDVTHFLVAGRELGVYVGIATLAPINSNSDAIRLGRPWLTLPIAERVKRTAPPPTAVPAPPGPAGAGGTGLGGLGWGGSFVVVGGGDVAGCVVAEALPYIR